MEGVAGAARLAPVTDGAGNVGRNRRKSEVFFVWKNGMIFSVGFFNRRNMMDIVFCLCCVIGWVCL